MGAGGGDVEAEATTKSLELFELHTVTVLLEESWLAAEVLVDFEVITLNVPLVFEL